ncbi:MAG: zf-HC2 domain-containing protein [Anaerolineaceae bacterium]|nr:zf-HC2 domain-containing protein [Anaerolineaceae bacterium]
MLNHDNCHELMDVFSEYIDGDLKKKLCDEIERHLADCENCSIVVNTLRKTVELYQVTSEPAELPDDMRQRLYVHLNLEDFIEKPAVTADSEQDIP